MPKQTTFGQRLRELRKAKSLTQRELAEQVARRLWAEDKRGFNFTYLSKIENDRTPPPSVAAIRQLAEVLDADVDELLTLAGKVPPQLSETLKDSAGARTFYRSVMNADLSEADWERLLDELKRGKKKR